MIKYKNFRLHMCLLVMSFDWLYLVSMFVFLLRLVVYFSHTFLFRQFVDLHGTIHDVRKAWDRHRKMFPHIMKPVTKCHGTSIGDNPLVKEVVERMQILVTASHQVCESDGHAGSRLGSLKSQSPEDRNHILSEGRVTGNMQGDINGRNEALVEVANDFEKDSVNDNNGRGPIEVAENGENQSINDNVGGDKQVEVAEDDKQVEVAEGVGKQSMHHNMGGDKLVEVAEEAAKQSMHDNIRREELVEVTEYVEMQSMHDKIRREELVEVTEDVEMQSTPKGPELHEEAIASPCECHDAAEIPEATVFPKVEDHARNHSHESADDVRPPAHPDNETQHSKPSVSHDDNIPQEATSGVGENAFLDEGNCDEVSAVLVSDPIDTKPSTPSRVQGNNSPSIPSQVQGNNSPLHSVCDSTPPESRSNPVSQMQAHPQITLQQDLPINVAHSQSLTSSGNWPQMYYIQSSQSQQLLSHPQLTADGTTSPQVVIAQGYPYQSHSWIGTVDQQQVNQTSAQYQIAAAHVYPDGTLAWPGQNAQQQAYAYLQLPSGAQPHTGSQVNQQYSQINGQQYGQTGSSQGISSQNWQYHQQQYYFLQQQQQNSQQLQSNSQPEQNIDQMQQMNLLQQQQLQPTLQLNQQVSSQQQQHIPNQPISTLLQQQQNQQISNQQQQQNQQSIQQLLQHQQLAQFQQHSQLVQNTQQYQQLLYMQQQQQQQLYLQQQQEYYLQQQQLMQQQQFQQLSHQEQQLLLQQQQQLLLQQQQQQVLQLQHQHQQQMQQLVQQSFQQQQQQDLHHLQQQPVQQKKQHQQTSPSELKALSSNYSQVHHIHTSFFLFCVSLHVLQLSLRAGSGTETKCILLVFL